MKPTLALFGTANGKWIDSPRQRYSRLPPQPIIYTKLPDDEPVSLQIQTKDEAYRPVVITVTDDTGNAEQVVMVYMDAAYSIQRTLERILRCAVVGYNREDGWK